MPAADIVGVISIARTMSDPHMNLRGLDSKSKVDVQARKINYASLSSFMNADPDEIGEYRLISHDPAHSNEL